MEILIDLHVLRTPKSEKHIFRIGLYVFLCMTVISINQKQITAETSNLIFYILIICRCYLKVFMKIELTLCTEAHKRILTHYGHLGGISC